MSEIKRLNEDLERVRNQIRNIEEGAQEFEIESSGSRRKAKNADLETLYRREATLEVKIRRLQGRGISRIVAGD